MEKHFPKLFCKQHFGMQKKSRTGKNVTGKSIMGKSIMGKCMMGFCQYPKFLSNIIPQLRVFHRKL
jgi:hypothetical protein